MIMSGIDPQTKKFTEPPEQIKKEIAALKADKSVPQAEKREGLAQLEAALKNARLRGRDQTVHKSSKRFWDSSMKTTIRLLLVVKVQSSNEQEKCDQSGSLSSAARAAVTGSSPEYGTGSSPKLFVPRARHTATPIIVSAIGDFHGRLAKWLLSALMDRLTRSMSIPTPRCCGPCATRSD